LITVVSNGTLKLCVFSQIALLDETQNVINNKITAMPPSLAARAINYDEKKKHCFLKNDLPVLPFKFEETVCLNVVCYNLFIENLEIFSSYISAN
jgi:hypothetical protein